MEQNAQETQIQPWEEAHPWLSLSASREEDGSVDEVICYTLDELRLA